MSNIIKGATIRGVLTEKILNWSIIYKWLYSAPNPFHMQNIWSLITLQRTNPNSYLLIIHEQVLWECFRAAENNGALKTRRDPGKSSSETGKWVVFQYLSHTTTSEFNWNSMAVSVKCGFTVVLIISTVSAPVSRSSILHVLSCKLHESDETSIRQYFPCA